MKPQHFFCYLAVVAVLFTACEKDKEKDYRAQWVGEWDFEVHSSYWELDAGIIWDTVYYSLGEISLESVDKLNIKITETQSIIFTVNEGGKLFESSFDCSRNGKFMGRDTIYINSHCGGNGGGTSSRIDGIKKEGGRNE